MNKLLILMLLGFMKLSIAYFTPFHELLKRQSLRPPTASANHSLDVKLGIYIESLGNFESTDMSFEVDLYIYMSWRDRRLKHVGPDFVMINDDRIRRDLWVPDLYFANARHATFQQVMQPNFNMFVAPNGQVAYSARCTLTVACSLDLRYYPMDNQICSIRTLSYAYIAKQVNVTWFEVNPITYNPEIALPEFYITKVEQSYCNGTYRYALMPNSYKIDEFSCLSGDIYLSRSIGYNLLQSYIPTSLIVIISWVSFWIDRRAVPARVTLSFTTLVSFTTLGSGLRLGLAQVSYAKAIDIWYGTCLLFVFLALLEFAIVNSFMRRAEKYDTRAKRLVDDVHRREKVLTRQFSIIGIRDEDHRRRSPLCETVVRVNGETQKLTENVPQNRNLLKKFAQQLNRMEESQEDRVKNTTELAKRFSRRALRIDQISRLLFPISFFVFNILYWTYYMIIRRDIY